jgi:hypothetical protein
MLIDSLISKNYEGAKSLLIRGANPEAILGEELGDHAICSSIDDRDSKYLKLLVEYGASANAYWNVDYDARRTPLGCSVYLLNFEAFNFLLENGADPSLDLYAGSIETYKNSLTALTIALSGKQYTMALKLVQVYSLHPAELKRLVYELEHSPWDESHPWSPARKKLVEWVRKRVPSFKPLPPNPFDGIKNDCLFSFRDHEEGLKKGTICWETEDE